MAKADTIEVIKQAIEKSPERKFLESLEISINLKDIDLSIPKNRVTEEIVLPKGRGKEVQIAIFASSELAHKAKDVADRIIQVDEMEDIAGEPKDARKLANQYTFFIAEAPLMPTIGKLLGKYLATRGKMPKPIPPSADPAPIIKNLRRSVNVRSKDKKTFHAAVGTKDMSPEDIAENVEVIMKRITGKLERGMQNIKSVYIKTTMGPSVRLS